MNVYYPSVLLFVLLFFIAQNIALAQDAQQKNKAFKGRCPDSFDKENPIDAEREKKIYDDMLKASEDDVITKELLIESGQLKQDTLRTQSTKSKRKVFSIPIIFHMFTYVNKGQVFGNVPKSAFEKQIEVMNEAFKSSGIEFTLSQLKVYENSTYHQDCMNNIQGMKTETGISNGKYLNVWICDMGFYLGMATFPWMFQEKSKMHGVILHYAALPKVEGYTPLFNYDEGDTLVHEVGHFFGLYHTFEGGCKSKDFVSDTPAEDTPAYGRPCLDSTPRNTCESRAGVDPVHNYMDYTDDICLDRFSPLQRARMRAVIMRSKTIMASKHKH